MVKSSKLITYGIVITVAVAGVYGLKRMLDGGNNEVSKQEVDKPTTWSQMVGNPQDDAASMRLTGKAYDTVTLGGKRRITKRKRYIKNKTMNKKR
jgi:hypothetical protein